MTAQAILRIGTSLLCSLVLRGEAIPSGTELEIRLHTPLSSYSSRPGATVLAELIAPVIQNNVTLLPQGSTLVGQVIEARRIGLGFSRETAMLVLRFEGLQLPRSSTVIPIATVISRLDDARERVDAQGRIHGIRATESFSSILAGFATSASAFDPMALIFGLSSSLSVFRVPDASIVLPAGCELHLKLTADLDIRDHFPSPYPAYSLQPGERQHLEALVKDLPYRTATRGDNTPSDLTSLLYLGSQAAIERAFTAAGWVRSDQLTGKSTYGVMRSIVENQGYRAAPMSVLTLDGKEPELAYAKTLNTFFSRHHLRIYSRPGDFEGQQLFTSTATYDSGIGFSIKSRSFIHIINQQIDEERTKVLHDLLLTGCVDGITYVDRPWVPTDAMNATGDTLRTDGRIAVVRLNACASPQMANAEWTSQPGQNLHANPYTRPIRATMLTLRNDLLRGNLIYQSFSGIKLGKNVVAPKKTAADEPRKFHYGGQEFFLIDRTKPVRMAGVPEDAGHKLKTETTRPKGYKSAVAFSLSAGWTGFGNTRFATQPFTLMLNPGRTDELRDPLNLETSLSRGWSIAPRFTLHSWKYISNEFGYAYSRMNFRLFGADQLTGTTIDSRSKATVRSYSYTTLFHLTPNGKRFRPYVGVGPTLQLTHLLDAPPSGSRLLRFAARDVAAFISAFDFGSKPALDGGGVFQLGLNYGAGATWYASHRMFLRVDYREILTGQPDLWKDLPSRLQGAASTPDVRLEYAPLIKHAAQRHQLVTLGIGVAF